MEKIIALIFDFDLTLSPSFQQEVIFKKWKINPQDFWTESIKLMKKGYDMEHAYLKNLIDYGKKDPKYSLSNKDLYQFGMKVPLFNGLSQKNNQESLFDEINQTLNSTDFKKKNIKLECYCISGGIKEMILGAFKAHKLTNIFLETFACSLDEDQEGKIAYIKETVGHTIKTQKIYMISKGISPNHGDDPALVNKKLNEYRIPLKNMIYFGDGQTDIPAFALINQYKGKSIAVYPQIRNQDGSINEIATQKNYDKAYQIGIKEKRTEDIFPADYSKKTPLRQKILNYIKEIAENIQ